MIFDCLQDSTTGLVSVGTVRETTVLRETKDFFEITCQFFGFHIKGTKTLNARCINKPPLTQRNHLGEGGSMLAGVVGIGNFSSAKVSIRHEAIDEGGLPHPTVATKKCNFTRQERFQLVIIIC